MAYFQEATDWIECHSLAAALASRTTFTVAFWIRSDPARTAPVPVAFSVADSIAAPTQWFAVFEVGGIYFAYYSDGVTTFTEGIGIASDDWRFVTVTVTPGSSSGMKVRGRTRLASASYIGAWETDLTYDNRPKPANNAWAEHSLANPLTPSVFGFYGHLVHLKVWGRELTDVDLWNESQRAQPWEQRDLIVWNTVLHEAGGYFVPTLGTITAAYTIPLSTPLDDIVHPPTIVKSPAPVQVLGVTPSGANPTLGHGTVAFSGTGLEVRTGIAAPLCGGLLAFAGAALCVAGVSNPALTSGVLAYRGQPLTAALGVAAGLESGVVAWQGQPLTAALGIAAGLESGVVSWQGQPLTAAPGVAATLPMGELRLVGALLQVSTPPPPEIVEGFDATVASPTILVTTAAQPSVTVAGDAVLPIAASDTAVTVVPATIETRTDDPPAVTVAC